MTMFKRLIDELKRLWGWRPAPVADDFDYNVDRWRGFDMYNGVDDGGFDGLGLCPRCGGAETRHGTLCLVCQNEERDDRG